MQTKKYLKDIEILDIKRWVMQYYEYKKAYSILKNKKKLYMQFYGKIAELMVSYELFKEDRVNWELDLEGDGGVDLIYEGKTIDVKCTTYWKKPELKENHPHPEEVADIYALVGIHPKTYMTWITGYVPSQKFLGEDNFIQNYRGLGSRYMMPKHKLIRNIKEAVKLVNEQNTSHSNL